jgi:hypothetical protein
MITIYSRKGKKCVCDLSQLEQLIKKGYTQTKPVSKKAGKVSTDVKKNPNVEGK